MAAAADASKVAAANLALLKIAAGTTLLAGWSQLADGANRWKKMNVYRWGKGDCTRKTQLGRFVG